MDVVETVFTDPGKVEVGTIPDSGLNVAYGSDDNDWEMTVRDDVSVPHNGLVYVRIRRDGKLVGTEYGGIRKTKNPHWDDSKGCYVVTYGGPSWHGMLDRKVISPPNGSEYLHVAGEANAAIGTVIAALGLTDMFAASTDASGIAVSHDFRYVSGYQGLTAMLSEAGAKLKMSFDGSKVVLWAEVIHDYSQDEEFDQTQVELSVKIDGNPVNHLVANGTGEGKDRIHVDLFMDAQGSVSETQSLFGADENAEVYDYTTADRETLVEDGTKRLKDYWDAATSIEVTVDASQEFDVGDIIGAIAKAGDETSTVSAYVTYKSATVVGEAIDIDYKAGTVLGTKEERAASSMTAQALAALNEAIAAKGIATAAQESADSAVSEVVEQYYLSTSPDEPEGGQWSNVRPTWATGQWIWTRSVITRGDGTQSTSEAVCVTGNTGSGIADVDVRYYLSDSASELLGGEWTTDYPGWQSGKWLWTKTVATMDDGTTSVSGAACVTGSPGEDAITVQLTSDNGTTFKNGEATSNAEVTVWHGTSEISDISALRAEFGSTASLVWSEKSDSDEGFAALDPDDPRISDDGFRLAVTASNVTNRLIFKCEVDV